MFLRSLSKSGWAQSGARISAKIVAWLKQTRIVLDIFPLIKIRNFQKHQEVDCTVYIIQNRVHCKII